MVLVADVVSTGAGPQDAPGVTAVVRDGQMGVGERQLRGGEREVGHTIGTSGEAALDEVLDDELTGLAGHPHRCVVADVDAGDRGAAGRARDGLAPDILAPDTQGTDHPDAGDYDAPARAHACTVRIASTALCPPKPKPEHRAVRISWARAVRMWSTPSQAGSRWSRLIVGGTA